MNKANVRAMMHDLDCGCGRHLEGKDEQDLTIKFLLHLEAAHPEIEEPTMELAEEMILMEPYGEPIVRIRSRRLFSRAWSRPRP
jgi:hypothetical protein